MSNNYETCLLEYKIHAEYFISSQLLLKNRIPNVYVIPSANSSFIWYGVVFIHSGLYDGGIFRFTIFIPDNFDCPRVIFNPIVYHPLINTETGELDLKQYISEWKANIHHIYHVLFYIRRIFFQIETKNGVNKPAAELFEKDYDLFAKNAKSSVDKCLQKIYDNPPTNADDPHSIKFSKLDPNNLNIAKQSMLNFVNDLNLNQSNSLNEILNEKENKPHRQKHRTTSLDHIHEPHF